MTNYLNTMTVKELREIAKRMNVKGFSALKKAELIGAIGTLINICHDLALDMNRSLHVDVPIVIDTVEFPMDHAQFTAWYNRRGGLESFDGFKAIEADHVEALDMNKADEVTYEINGVFFYGVAAQYLHNHDKAIRRYNPMMKRDKDGVVILTAAQQRRMRKNGRRNAKKIGLFANA